MKRRDEITVENLDIDSIVDILDGFPVTVGILFGSYARGEATQFSDIDLAVEFDESLTSSERTQNRIALIKQLSTTIETDEIDVIPLSSAPSSLIRAVCMDGIHIYGSKEALDNYQCRSPEMGTHADRLDQFEALLTDLKQIV